MILFLTKYEVCCVNDNDAVAARHMRQLRPGLGRASPVILGKRIFFLRKRNQIRVSLYVSHNTR